MIQQHSHSQYSQYLQEVITIAIAAGEATLQVYVTDFSVSKKQDCSPLTQADLAAHQTIVEALKLLTPDIPILSEESETLPYEIRQGWSRYWLIDPLDGTREFVKRNGEFTVNIALIDENTPVMGIVYAPVTGLLYFAAEHFGAYKKNKNQVAQVIQTKQLDVKRPILAVSRSYSDKNLKEFIENLETSIGTKPELISMGSSLKICMVAEGVADLYPRLGLTSEWDTAAAHCILREAGGDIVVARKLVGSEVSETLRYNTKPSLLNPFFFATNDYTYNWARFL